MEFLKFSKPNKQILNTCIKLANEINKFDNMNNPIFEIDEFNSIDLFPTLYYAIENKELIGFIGVSLINKCEIEICGFVQPQYRNLKVASHLLELLFDDYENFKIIIPLAYDNSLGKLFLSSYNAKYQSTECIMELKKENYQFYCPTINILTSINQQTTNYKAFENNIEIGSASVYKDKTFIIHNVEIYPKFRGQKYGQALLHTLLLDQFNLYDKVTLHVTKENTPAFNLYTKLGFTILEQLEYYSL